MIEVLRGDELRVGSLGAAVFSSDGRRRRWLSYRLSDAPKRCGFVMLNPSKAGAEKPDPTVTRCIGFARREGAGSLEIANLADIVETDSTKLGAFVRRGEATDDNSRHYLLHVLCCGLVIVAWGAHAWARGRLAQVREIGVTVPSIFWCLGRTKAGAPKHPLYVRADAPLELWP